MAPSRARIYIAAPDENNGPRIGLEYGHGQMEKYLTKRDMLSEQDSQQHGTNRPWRKFNLRSYCVVESFEMGDAPGILTGSLSKAHRAMALALPS